MAEEKKISTRETMKMLLDGLYEEIEENESRVRKNGVVSGVFCDGCYRKEWDFETPTRQLQKTLDAFIEWVKEYEIFSMENQDYGSYLEIKSMKKIILGSRKVTNEVFYKYTWKSRDSKSKIAQELGKIRGLKTILRTHKIELCQHSEKYTTVKKIKRLEAFRLFNRNFELHDSNHVIIIGCEECVSLKSNNRCDDVRKNGFLYNFRCPFRQLVLEQRLLKLGIPADTGDYDPIFELGGWRTDNTYYWRELDALLIIGRFDKETIKHLNPSLLVLFCPYIDLYKYLEYDTDVLFYDKDGFYFYDKDKEIETSLAVIYDTIISELNPIMDGLRGNDHDRTISALNQIGDSLGYVTKREYSKPGLRIDLVWYDREGKIQVAGEVETSSTWKKDLVSTWEVEPRLAIIVGFAKSDRVSKNLMSITLMKYIPHPVLYINKVTDNTFLFEKNALVKALPLLN